MKPISTILLLFTLATTVSHANSIKSTKTDTWGQSSTWNPSRLPKDNDTIIIPIGDTVTVNNTYALNYVTIIVYGKLLLNFGKLHLDGNSRVIVAAGGVLSGNGSQDQLRIGNETKFNGTDPDVTGYSIADINTPKSPYGFVMSPLPVIFQSFYASRETGGNQLSWITSTEINNSYFAVEKSTDGRTWKQVAVIPGAGTSTVINKYSYTDKNISNANTYYRIRQVDANDQVLYSSIRTIYSNGKTFLTNIYPSSKQSITIDFNSDIKDDVMVQIVNMNGQIVVRQQYKQASYRLTLNVPLGAGIYAVRVSDGNGWNETKKIVL